MDQPERIRALLLTRPFAGQKSAQTVLLVPLMVAPVIAAIMMRWMFNDQFGIVNAVLEGLGLEGQPWLVEGWTAFGVVVMTDIWLWAPWDTPLRLEGRPWLVERWPAVGVFVMTDIWLWPPGYPLLLRAALQSLQGEPFEAAA